MHFFFRLSPVRTLNMLTYTYCKGAMQIDIQ